MRQKALYRNTATLSDRVSFKKKKKKWPTRNFEMTLGAAVLFFFLLSLSGLATRNTRAHDMQRSGKKKAGV